MYTLTLLLGRQQAGTLQQNPRAADDYCSTLVIGPVESQYHRAAVSSPKTHAQMTTRPTLWRNTAVSGSASTKPICKGVGAVSLSAKITAIAIIEVPNET